MRTYGQYCPIARGAEIFAERWTPLIIRDLVERFFNKLKHFRAFAARFQKRDANYLALVKLAAARIWMRACESVT